MKRNGLGQIKNAVSIRERPPRSMSIFVILDLPGSAGQTKTPTDCCASIFRVAPICPCTARPSSVLSQGSSMKGRERPCSIRHRLKSSQNVLQRSVELAARSGHWLTSTDGGGLDVVKKTKTLTCLGVSREFRTLRPSALMNG